MTYDPTSDPWLAEVRRLVERVLDDSVLEFLRSPLLHRVEHCLHVGIIGRLTALPHFSQVKLSDGSEVRVVAEEWPETRPRPGHGNRRGNFDITILPPALLRFATAESYRVGRISAPLVVEVGLDYSAKHLAADESKLVHSGVTFPYLLHLQRREVPDALTTVRVADASIAYSDGLCLVFRIWGLRKLIADTQIRQVA